MTTRRPDMAAVPAGRRPPPPSLHGRIVAEIAGRILTGEWPPGTRVPSEVELAGRFGCARMTVNKALSELARGGLVERRRKAGSFVARPRAETAVLEIQEIKAEVEATGQPYRYELVSRALRRATAEERAALGLSRAAGNVLAIEVLHRAGEAPFCLEERLINLAAVPAAAAADFSASPPGAWLIAHVPWTEAEHRIRAAAADPRLALALGLESGAACLVIERRTWSRQAAVTRVRLTYPAGAGELVARFAPAQL